MYYFLTVTWRQKKLSHCGPVPSHFKITGNRIADSIARREAAKILLNLSISQYNLAVYIFTVSLDIMLAKWVWSKTTYAVQEMETLEHMQCISP